MGLDDEMARLAASLDEQTPWDEIEEYEFYHVPRIRTQKSLDIVVIRRHEAFLEAIIRMDDVVYPSQKVMRGSLTAVMMSKVKRF